MRPSVAVAALAALTAMSVAVADDSRTIRTQERPLGAFDTIVVDHDVDTDVTIGGVSQVTVEAAEEDIGRIRTEVRGSTLYIENSRHVHLEFCLFSCGSKSSPKVHIVMPKLVEFDNEGSGDARLQGLSGEALKIRIAGSGDVDADGHVRDLQVSVSSSGEANFGRLSADAMDVNLSGSGDFTSAGARKTVQLRSSGSGDAHLDDLDVDSMEVIMDGAGEVMARGKARSLVASVSSSGDAHFENFSADSMNLQMSGSGDLYTGGTHKSLQLRASSSGDAHLRHLDAESTDVVVAGSGGVVADGQSKQLHLTISSSGDADFGGVSADKVVIKDSSSGDVSVTANQSIDAITSGSGDIDWKGEATRIFVRSSGNGDIRQH